MSTNSIDCRLPIPKSSSSYFLPSLRQATAIAYQADRLHLLGKATVADFIFYYAINSKYDSFDSTVLVMFLFEYPIDFY